MNYGSQREPVFGGPACLRVAPSPVLCQIIKRLLWSILLIPEVLARASLTASAAYRPFVPDQLVWGIAIALALAGVALTGAAIRKRAEAQAQAAKALKAKARKPKARKAKAKPATTATVLGFPRLVAANDV